MIKYHEGDLFESNADALAHGCNTHGKMGAGIAKEFKKRFPEMYKDYLERCRNEAYQIGTGYLYKNTDKPHVINLATQGRGRAKLEHVDSVLQWLFLNYNSLGLSSVAMPKICTGLGGLEWDTIKEILNKYFNDSPLIIEVWSL